MYNHSVQWPTLMTTDQVGGEVNKVGIVLVDELHHGRLQQLIVELQVLSHLLQLDLLPTIRHKLIDVEVTLQTERQQHSEIRQTRRTFRRQTASSVTNIWTNKLCQKMETENRQILLLRSLLLRIIG